MNENLRACLEGYAQVGERDSSGEFTLSQDHARKKLQEFTLPEPRLYVLSLVAGAVCGGASGIEFRCDADELWMTHDGQLENPRELEAIESVLFSNRVGSPIRETVIGLSGLLPLKPRKVELKVTEPDGVHFLRWDGQAYHYQREEHGGAPRIDFYVQERAGLRVARKFAAKVGGGMLPDSEEDAIFRYCNRCPLPLTFNEQPANRPVILGNCRHLTFSHTPFAEDHPLAELGVPVAAPQGVSGLLALGGRLAPWVTLVYQGVNFRLPENAFSRPGLRGIVYCENLRKDLSQVQLVQDEAFTTLISNIESLANGYL